MKKKTIIFIFLDLLVLVCFFVFYGPFAYFRNLIISTAMVTKTHQWVAYTFFSEKAVSKVIEANSYIPIDDEVDLDEIVIDNKERDSYDNKYDEIILTREPGNEDYKYIEIKVGGYKAHLVAIYDPSKVKIATSRGAGTSDSSYGQILSQIAKDNNALVAMNAGGFYDPNWSSNGGIPHGMVIKDGKLLTNFRRGIESGGMIGFDEDNRLILKRVSAEEALNMKIRDAVDWGPYLIVDGVNYFKEENYRWACARTVIGQRKDGIVLLLVIDGSQPHSKGASYSDLADIMEKYGAYNAANLDGGTSTSMVKDNEYINIPFNGQKRTIRSLPNAWIVVE